jgi:Flp pilus assembly protein TadD
MMLFHQLARKWRAAQQEGAVRAAYEEGRLEEAISHARSLYEFDLDNPWANFFLACHHLEAERYAEALLHLERVRRDWPDDAHTHFALGLCHDYLEAPRAAAEDYGRVLELAPSWAKARKNLGRDLYLLGDYPAAESALRPYCAASPDDREAHDLLGYVCYRQGKMRDSFGHYESARRLDPFNPAMERNARVLYMKSARS